MILWQIPVGHINNSLADNSYDENGVFDPLTNTTRQYEDSAPTFFFGDTFTATGDRLDYFSSNEFGDDKLTVSGNTVTWGLAHRRGTCCRCAADSLWSRRWNQYRFHWQ